MTKKKKTVFITGSWMYRTCTSKLFSKEKLFSKTFDLPDQIEISKNLLTIR